MLPPFAEHLDVDNIHVQAPVAVIFLCGGETSKASELEPRSIRDAFLKCTDNPILTKREFFQAEDISVFYVSSAYPDLLKFEVDLAQITELIVLFCESPGSFAELGSFSMLPEIAERLLVILRDKHYNDVDSFIRLGPLRSIQSAYGDTTVCVIDDKDINIIGEKVAAIDKNTLRDRLLKPITDRIEQIREPTTFDPQKSGHLIKLIVGLIQEYGALTILEIEELLLHVGILKRPNEINSYLLCAIAVKWIKQEKKGINTYFFALPMKDAANLTARKSPIVKDKFRRRQAIREYWEKNDPDRYRGIVAYMGGKQ